MFELSIEQVDFSRKPYVVFKRKIGGTSTETFRIYVEEVEQLSELLLQAKSILEFVKSKNSYGKISPTNSESFCGVDDCGFVRVTGSNYCDFHIEHT